MQPANDVMEAWLASEPQAASPGNELKKRVLSALVLAPAALWAGILGGFPFAVLIAAVAAISFWEWTGISAVQPQWLRVGGAGLPAAGLLALVLERADLAIALIGVAALLALSAGVRRPSFRWAGIGLLYVAAPCAALVLLREAEPHGWAAILFLVAVVWTTDTAAYFGGRRLGGAKLWLRVSPKKTWSGALTGMAAAMAAGGLVAALTGAASFGIGVLLAAPLSAASQAGDLFESAVKRRFGAKDSGRIIPGHGGVLDRVDGLFGAAALAWLMAALGWGGQLLVLPHDVAALPGGGS